MSFCTYSFAACVTASILELTSPLPSSSASRSAGTTSGENARPAYWHPVCGNSAESSQSRRRIDSWISDSAIPSGAPAQSSRRRVACRLSARILCVQFFIVALQTGHHAYENDGDSGVERIAGAARILFKATATRSCSASSETRGADICKGLAVQ